jgi:hypothetical protein
MVPGKRMNHAVLLIAIVSIIVIGGYLVFSSGFFAKGTSLEMKAEVESESCRGSAGIFAELIDENGKRVPGALIHFYQGNQSIDSLYTDRNGRVEFEKDIDPAFCGRVLEFSAEVEGNSDYQPSSAAAKAPMRAPTYLSLEVPKSALEGGNFTAEARLTNAVNGLPLQGKSVKVDSLSSITGQNGSAYFELEADGPDARELKAVFAGDDFFEPSESSARIRILPPTCEGRVLIGDCSGTLLCTEELELVADCAACGCAGGLICEENQCITEEQKTLSLIERLQMSNVKIMSDEGIGSGVIMAKNASGTYILTNRHVVDVDFALIANSNMEVINYREEVALPAQIFISPNQLDLAIVVVKKEIGPAADLDYSLKPKVGSEVVVLGSPLGIPNSVSKGIVSNFVMTNTTSGYEYEVIQTDAAVNPGSSGGGVFLTSSGHLIGVTSFKLVIGKGQLAEGLGFAVPISLLDQFPPEDWSSIPPVHVETG